METGCHAGGFRQVLMIISWSVTVRVQKCIIDLLSRGEKLCAEKVNLIGKLLRQNLGADSRASLAPQCIRRGKNCKTEYGNLRLEIRMIIHRYHMLMQEKQEKG